MRRSVTAVLFVLRSEGIEPPQVAKSAMEGKRCETIRLNVLRKRNLAATAAGYFPQGNYLHDSPARVTTKRARQSGLLIRMLENIQ